MATLREYFDKHPGLTIHTQPEVTENGNPVETIVAEVFEFEAGVRYYRIFIGDCEQPDGILAHILSRMDELSTSNNGMKLSMGFSGANDATSSESLKFSGKYVLYSKTEIPRVRWETLIFQLRAQGRELVVRDPNYARAREKYEKPIAFLSHDSRDKDFVRPLAVKLATMGCPVWYDEFSLVPGQSLRESIEKGISECGKCVVVLSKNFFSNRGWSAREFETVYQKEILHGKRYMIPIWLGVTKQDVYDYSPILLDTFGINGALSEDEIAGKLLAALKIEPADRGWPEGV